MVCVRYLLVCTVNQQVVRAVVGEDVEMVDVAVHDRQRAVVEAVQSLQEKKNGIVGRGLGGG